MGNHYYFVCLFAAFHDFIGSLYFKRNVRRKFSGHRARRFAVRDVRYLRNFAGHDFDRKQTFEFFPSQELSDGSVFVNRNYDYFIGLYYQLLSFFIAESC